MTSASTLEIVIVSHNTSDDLEACLASIHAAPPQALSRVVVVDNASTDDSVERVRTLWPRVSVVALARNVGFGAANNVALREPGPPLVLLLNSDTIVPAGAIDRLIERLTATGATAAGPLLVDGAGAVEVSFGPMLSPVAELRQRLRVRAARRRDPFSRAWVRRLVARERTVDWVTGACLLVRRDAAVAAGLFDERYFMYEEDVDFCAALRAGGGTILFTPHARVVHLRGRSVRRAGNGRRSPHYDRSHLLFYEKHRPGWARWLRRWQRRREQ